MERPVIVASVICPACGATATADSQRCTSCGAIHSSPSGSHPSSPAAGPAKARGVIDCRWQLLLLLFGATGVLGLPLLWNSRAFGLVGKFVVSVLVTLWTALLVWLCWWSLTWSAGRLGIEW